MRITKWAMGVLQMMMALSVCAEEAVERIVWDKTPIGITLAVGQERLVSFPGEVRVGVPAELEAKLRTQSNNGTVYWRAEEAFGPQRVEVRSTNGGGIYLVDLKASKNAGVATTPIVVMNKGDGRAEATVPGGETGRKRTPDFVTLTRFAAKELYAPARLRKTPRGVHRVSVGENKVPHLIRGVDIAATPVASWQKGFLYVTAIKLQNLMDDYVTLDPRNLRGAWRAAAFQHPSLHAKGAEGDTTALYVISTRPFHEAL